jgi:hypothetical protein
MSNRKLQEFDEYAYGARSVLRPGDLFRVSGGPYYENEDGSKMLMAERGTFKFVRYCEKGASKWIEAGVVGGSGTVVLWVGKKRANPDLPRFKQRPYKIRKVTDRKRRKKPDAQPQAAPAKRQTRGPAKAAAGSSAGSRAGGGAGRKSAARKGVGRGKGSPSTLGSTSI